MKDLHISWKTWNPGSPLAGELRPGMSVYPTIETKSQERRTASASGRRG
jgi:membrane fusion protein (multidrug efflux system)